MNTDDSEQYNELSFYTLALRDASFIFTPKHDSWQNTAEIELHILNGQCLNRHISSVKKITEEVDAWQEHRNNKNSKINWQFTNKEARVKLKKYTRQFMINITVVDTYCDKNKLDSEEMQADLKEIR